MYYLQHLLGVQRVFTSCGLAFIELHEASRRASQAPLLVERLKRGCSLRQVCEGGAFKLSYMDWYNVVSKPERKPGKTLGRTDHAFDTRSPSYPGHIVRLPQPFRVFRLPDNSYFIQPARIREISKRPKLTRLHVAHVIASKSRVLTLSISS